MEGKWDELEKLYDGGIVVEGPISTSVSLADVSNIHFALCPMLDALLRKRSNGIFTALHVASCT